MKFWAHPEEEEAVQIHHRNVLEMHETEAEC